MGALDRVGSALCVALDACRRTDGIGGLLHQQRLVAVQGVEAAQAFLQVRAKLGQGQLHGLSGSRAV